MLLGQRGQQQEMVVRRIGSCYIVLHSRTYIEIEGAHRLFAISRHILHVFYFCAVVFFCVYCVVFSSRSSRQCQRVQLHLYPFYYSKD